MLTASRTRLPPSGKAFFVAMSVAGLLFFLLLLFLPSSRAQLSTADHLAEPGFWPTQNAHSRRDYLGPSACAPCHARILTPQRSTPMGGTTRRAGDSNILQSHPLLNFAVVKYSYEIKTAGGASAYTVTDGSRSLTASLLWAFGTGRVGQSFLFKQADGNFYEARVTYFETLQNLHFTPARALDSPKDLEEAMYRPVAASEVRRCFGCHTTASIIDDHLQERDLILGVSCEACHGPGAKHVAAMQAAKLTGVIRTGTADMFDPLQLGPVDSVDFCGACHGTWWDVKLSGVTGVSSTRSQPYRLESSKCWGKGDARLTCVACHDPHRQLQSDPSAYDANCLGCHLTSATAKKTADHPAPPCPVSTQKCVSCHMPKVYVPEMHHDFSDHRIRIARAGEPFPE